MFNLIKWTKSFSLFGLLLISILGLSLLFIQPLHALESMSENEMSNVDASEGLALDMELIAMIDQLSYFDSDGDGTGNEGAVQFGSGTDGITLANDVGGPVNFSGITVDATPSGLADGTGAIVIGTISKKINLSIDEMFFGGTNDSAFQVDLEGIDFGGADVKIGAKS